MSTERSVDNMSVMSDRWKSFTTTCTLVVVLGLFLFGVVMCLPGLYAEIAPGIAKLFEQR